MIVVANKKRMSLAAVPLLVLSFFAAADQAIIIGGGSNIDSSQGQIELNVKWVQDVLVNSKLDVTTFYTDGNSDTPDVHYQIVNDGDSNSLSPIARVFGDVAREITRYRNHTVPGVVSSTERSQMEPVLDVLLGQQNTEPTLLVYNGHGDQSSSTPDQVSLRLWNDSSITANELHKLLNSNPTPFRFVFTQCYSGGFHRVAYKNPSKGIELAEGQRCGFTAESAYRLAEGCSSSVETEDYRDYTTFFFAAVSGYDRDGEIIDKDPDINQDQQVSMREAHLFTLEKAFSTDLSRSTSEDYLTAWEPWYLKWLPGSSYLPNNEYARLFRDVAAKYDIPLKNGATKSIRALQKLHTDTIAQITHDQSRTIDQLDKVKSDIQSLAIARWPDLAGPYTRGFAALAGSDELTDIGQWLETVPDYPSVVELEQQLRNLDVQLLESERMVTQMLKLMRLRRIANLKQWLYDYGTDKEIAAYESLLECEEQPLKL